jgi:serine/threonine protein phosphatase PrpC
MFLLAYISGSNKVNVPKDGSLHCLSLRDKDIIVLMSDGVLDNMTEAEIVNEVNRHASRKAPLIAKKICTAAFAGSQVEGGKPDDITTLVVKYKE